MSTMDKALDAVAKLAPQDNEPKREPIIVQQHKDYGQPNDK